MDSKDRHSVIWAVALYGAMAVFFFLGSTYVLVTDQSIRGFMVGIGGYFWSVVFAWFVVLPLVRVLLSDD